MGERFVVHQVQDRQSFGDAGREAIAKLRRQVRDLTVKRLRRGSFISVSALVDAIKAFLDNRNQNPQVFVWSAPVERILAKIAKCKEALGAGHQQEIDIVCSLSYNRPKACKRFSYNALRVALPVTQRAKLQEL